MVVKKVFIVWMFKEKVKEKMKTIFLGTTNFSKEMFIHLLKNNIQIEAVFGMPKEFNISYSKSKVTNFNFADMEELAKEYRLKYIEVDSTNGKRLTDYSEIIESIQPDVILVLGWYYMVPKKIRDLAKHGAWGIHASLLPEYAGGAPLVWAVINGEKEAGITLFKLSDGVDDGDIIKQSSFPIAFEDTIKEVYNKAIKVSKDALLESLLNINKIKFLKQDSSKLKVWPQRKPEDGEIDLNKDAKEIYNFIRAQSDPYPGAFLRTKDNKKLIIEKARIEDF